MSGHSGFQPIGNNLPPIIPQPQIGDVRGPGQAPQSQPPAVSGGDEPARDYKVREDAAKALTRKFDTMLLQAAKLSTRTVDDASLKSAMDAAHLGKADRKDLADAAKKAQKATKNTKPHKESAQPTPNEITGCPWGHRLPACDDAATG